MGAPLIFQEGTQMIKTPDLTATRQKAQAIWDSMDKNERTGVRFGMFPHGKMVAAEQEGHNGKDLAVALMDLASKNGGMRA